MEDANEKQKRLEMHVKRVSSVRVQGEQSESAAAEAHNLASPDVSYIGSMVSQEDAFPTGMRRRVIEAPFGSKVGYHELGDEREEADVEWMTGDASQLSGAGTRGSRNWVLKIMLPILLVVGIICMHQWWTDIKRGISDAINGVGDAVDRRALEGIDAGIEGEQRRALSEDEEQEQEADVPDKAVYSVGLQEGDPN